MTSISNLRLTCRRFANVAAEFLLPQVHVTLDQASLDRVDEISRHPTISRGVRIACVNLDYRPGMTFKGLPASSRSRIPLTRESVGHMGPSVAGSGRDNGVTRHQAIECTRIAREGRFAYLWGHLEQRQLIETGSFARGLAASLSRMPQFDTLVIDNQDSYSGPAGQYQASVESVGAPFTWQEIEANYHSGDLEPVSLLCELPVAIHAAGRSLKRFMLRGFPVRSRDIRLLAPAGEGSSFPAWDDLRDALQSVKYVQLQDCREVHPNPLNEWDHLDHYINIVVSGRPRIEVLPRRPPDERILPHNHRWARSNRTAGSVKKAGRVRWAS